MSEQVDMGLKYLFGESKNEYQIDNLLFATVNTLQNTSPVGFDTALQDVFKAVTERGSVTIEGVTKTLDIPAKVVLLYSATKKSYIMRVIMKDGFELVLRVDSGSKDGYLTLNEFNKTNNYKVNKNVTSGTA